MNEEEDEQHVVLEVGCWRAVWREGTAELTNMQVWVRWQEPWPDGSYWSCINVCELNTSEEEMNNLFQTTEVWPWPIDTARARELERLGYTPADLGDDWIFIGGEEQEAGEQATPPLHLL